MVQRSLVIMRIEECNFFFLKILRSDIGFTNDSRRVITLFNVFLLFFAYIMVLAKCYIPWF